MLVSGEAYFFINIWMNYCALFLAAVLIKRPMKSGKCLFASILGGIYALFAWETAFFRGIPILLCVAACMAFLAFGRDFLQTLPILFGAGFLLSGTSGFLMKHSVPSLWILLFTGGFSLLISRIFRRSKMEGKGDITLFFGMPFPFSVPAFRDSGNLLSDPVTALPVIVAPHALLSPILPKSLDIHDLATLPPHWRLIRIQTAGGEKTLMAFHPQELFLQEGEKKHQIDALIALSDFSETRALLPDAIFHQEERKNASL